jgi:hypothetical protein
VNKLEVVIANRMGVKEDESARTTLEEVMQSKQAQRSARK